MNLIKKFYKVLAFNATTDDHYIHQISGPTTPWPQLNDLINDSDTVLELGCGTGWLSNRIAHNWHSVDVTGIDLLEENTQYAERFAYSNSRFITQDLLECDRTADTNRTLTSPCGGPSTQPRKSAHFAVPTMLDTLNAIA